MGADEGIVGAILVVVGIVGVGGIIVGGCYVGPKYHVWQQEQAGRAELARAESNRKIAVQEAHAKKDSAKELADAEVIRAEGVAQANKIIGDSLKGNDAYLRYLWIQGLNDSSGEVIYVPTEANLPILEAGKRYAASAEAKQ